MFRIVHNLIAHPLTLIPFEWTTRFHDWTALWGYPPHAACLLFVRDNKVLAVARRGTTDQWGLPGGKVEGDESAWLTAVRETSEEAKVVPLYIRELYRGIDDTGASVVTYIARQISGEPRQGDAGPAGFVSWDQLFEGPFGRYNREVHKQWLQTLKQ